MRLVDLEAEIPGEGLSLFLSDVAPTLAPYADCRQWGIREGTTLLEHLMNGALFIGSVLPALGFGSDDIRTLLAAFTVHDANKMLGDNRSLAKISLASEFEELWRRHRLDALVPDSGRDEVRTLVVNTSNKHGKPFDMLLAPRDEQDRLTRLRPALIAADIHDLSPTFEERKQKDVLLGLIREASGRDLELFYHLVDEDLGAFSALAHTAAAQVLQVRGCIETWVYPEGSWYLGEAHPPVEATEMVEAWSASREEVLGRGIGRFIDTYVKDGFKLDPSALARYTDAALTVEMADHALQRSPDARFKTLTEKRRPRYDELPDGLQWPETPQATVPGRLWLAAENLLKQTKRKKEATKLLIESVAVERPSVAQVGHLVLKHKAAVGMHPVSDVPFVFMASLPGDDAQRVACKAFEHASRIVREELNIEVGTTPVAPEVAAWLGAVRFGPEPQRVPLARQARTALAQYAQGNASSFGSTRGPLVELKTDVVPKGTPVSQFSNRQGAGRGDPKRQVDRLQYESIRLQTKTSPFPSSAPLYLHLRPRRGTTPFGWRASAGALGRIIEGREETGVGGQLRAAENGMTIDFVPRNWGALPTRERPLHGNGVTMPWRPLNKHTELDAWLDALILAVAIADQLSVNVRLSRQLLGGAPDDRLSATAIPISARWLVPCTCTDEELPALIQTLSALQGLAARYPGKNYDTASLLVRAGSRGLFPLFAALTKRAALAPVGAVDVRDLLLLYPEEKMTQRERAVFPALAEMARLTASKLKTSDYKRNDLARPLNELFKAIRRVRSPDDLELGLATAEDRIFEAKRTDSRRHGFEVGSPTLAAARAFIASARTVIEASGGPVRLRADERMLRSAFVALVRRELDDRRPPNDQE